VSATREKFIAALDDDLNTSAALAAIFDFVRSAYQLDEQGTLGPGDARSAIDFLRDVDRVLAVLRANPELLDAEIAKRIEERQAARRRRDFRGSGPDSQLASVPGNSAGRHQRRSPLKRLH